MPEFIDNSGRKASFKFNQDCSICWRVICFAFSVELVIKYLLTTTCSKSLS